MGYIRLLSTTFYKGANRDMKVKWPFQGHIAEEEESGSLSPACTARLEC